MDTKSTGLHQEVSNGIITQGMADPNRKIIGYISQEVLVESATTSGVFWSNVKTRDNRQFPGAAEKTLQGQGLKSVSPEGTRAMLNVKEEVRPPEINPS